MNMLPWVDRGWRVVLLAAFLVACSGDPGTGPVDVKWDRDPCERCRMVVSEHNFAAEVRGGPKRQAFKFDDVGCALIWLDEQEWNNDPAVEVWVADLRTGQWLDARKARFVTASNTPMDYGIGAVAQAEEGSFDFAEARKRIFAKEAEYRSADQQHSKLGLHDTTPEMK